MRLAPAALLFSCLALTGAVASAGPKASKARAPEQKVAALSASASDSPKPTSFTKNPSKDGWFKDNLGGEWQGKAGRGDALETDRLGNESVTAGIYRLAESTFGTSAPEVRLATVDGKPYLMAKKVSLSEQKQLTDEQLKKFSEGFVIDAWLANWDAGGGWQLTADTAGRPLRIDGGGAGLFRSRGEPKGTAFSDEVGELTTMRDPLRPTSAGYRKLTDKDVKGQLAKFATWYPEHKADIEAAVDGAGLSGQATAMLKSKLGARATWLIAQAKK